MFRTDKSRCSSTWSLHGKNSFAYLSRWDTWCSVRERWKNPGGRTWLHLFWFSIFLFRWTKTVCGFSASVQVPFDPEVPFSSSELDFTSEYLLSTENVKYTLVYGSNFHDIHDLLLKLGVLLVLLAVLPAAFVVSFVWLQTFQFFCPSLEPNCVDKPNK